MKIKNWKENMVKKAKKEKEGEPQSGSSKDEPKPGGASKDKFNTNKLDSRL